MRTWILLVFGILVIVLFALWFRHDRKQMGVPATIQTETGHPAVAKVVATNQNIAEIGKLLVNDYHSTNEHDAITSALAHELIAEELRTNAVFLEWASNITKAVISHFMTNGNVPVYGSAGFTIDALQLDKVTVNGMVGMYAMATYDPDPTNEGPLEFIVEGGIHPTLLRVQNSYRLINYQLSPERWKQSPRNIGRMDWSSAMSPLDKGQISTLAYHAFHEMTGLDLGSFQLETTKINVEGILNPNAAQHEVSVTGNLKAKLYTPKDYRYPFAEFRYDDTTPKHEPRVAFSGQIVQTSSGHGEFVELSAVVRKTEAIFELGEGFLGQGTWEQSMLDNVRSLDTEQRSQVYKRIFQR